MQYEPACEIFSIIKDILLSWIIGVIFASIFIEPFILAAFQYFNHGNDYWLRDFNILKGMQNGLFISLFGFVITAPLMAIAALTAVVFRENIQRNLVIWCVVAPFLIWVFYLLGITFSCDNDYCQTHSFAHVFYIKMKGIDNLLFLAGPMPASAVFYFFRKK